MAWSVVQSNSVAATASTATSQSVAFVTQNLSSGTTVFAAFAAAAGVASAPTGPSATCGGVSMNLVGQITPSGGAGISSLVTLFALNTPAGQVGTEPTVQGNWTNAATASLLIQEVAGIATGTASGTLWDGNAGTLAQNSTGNTSVTTGAYPSTALNEYLVFVYGDDGGPATLPTPSSSYQLDAKTVNNNSHADIAIAWKNSGNTAESATATLTGTAPVWGTILVAFMLAPGAPVLPPVTQQMPNRPYVQVFRAGGGSL